MKKFLASLFFVFLLALPAWAEETIIKFASDVTVNTDASIDVVESIGVLSESNRIRHGIFRDFPTRYTDRNGVQKRVDFSVKSVMRNGEAENFAIESISGGERIRIGDKDVLLGPGIHKYVITYHATRELGFFDKYDELYWNVTGNAWQFSIQNAVVNVHLPSGAVISQSAVYTGSQGTNGKDAAIETSQGREFTARATRVLQPNEGLTVAVAWQKGIVAAPTASQQQLWMVRDNAGYGALIATIFAVAGYFYWAWSKVGRDPPSGTIIPLFHPPESLGPAALRFIWKQSFDDRTMASGLVGLAVKGRLKIENDKGEYTLTKLENKTQSLNAIEESTYNMLPSGSLVLHRSNHATIRGMKSALQSLLQKKFEGSLFLRNLGWTTIGVVLSLIGLAISVFLSPEGVGMPGVFIGIFAAVFWSAILGLGWASVKGAVSSQGIFGKLKSIATLIFLVPFVGAAIAIPFGIAMSQDFPPALFWFIAAAVIVGLLNLIFAYLMPAPTEPGRRILDAIEGFRLYMTTAEEKRLDALNPPEKTPELFERYLPYAMALDCENAWNAKFASVLAAAAAAGAAVGAGWYYGYGRSDNDLGNITNSLGSGLASTLSSSSIAPGSSSGSGGGGSSGGGGGGGGGGGW